MALDFTVKDVIHKVTAKFVHAFLPEAKKPYNLRAVFQPELDIHGIASKAEVYNIETDPKVIEEGLTAACELMYYLAADGYKLKTPLFNLRIRLPGEYEGAETNLSEGLYPEVRMQSAAPFRRYIRDRVRVQFDGIDQADGLIAEALDEHTGQVDEVMTLGNLLDIRGYGLKIEADDLHKDEAGLFFDDGQNPPIKAEILAVNEPRTLKAIVPAALTVGAEYTLKVVTQSSVHTSGHILKEVRNITSDFKLTAQA
ncbi:MAG: DUF4469 domain-containing protein [Spirochaetaceae bacterium]|jgi:hypothetical protein|nr:DUF4469 domain-containing protein [Spirochaetaceae bacterium]